jgi:short-subunit dehydrogenase
VDAFFKDKAFIVTGASSGLGRSIAKLLAENGAAVTIMARTKTALEDLRQASGGTFLVQPGDVTRPGDCENVVRATVDTFGKLDGLIHNAGVSMRARAAETNAHVYQDLMAVNFLSMVYLFQASLPHIEKTRGHMAAVSSMMGRYATQERSGYNASKHALQGFMDSIRIELMRTGVHVMVASPGFIQTNNSVNALTADGSPYGRMDNALAKGLTPDKTARIILKGLKHRKRDVFPAGPREKLGLLLSKWAPGLLDRVLLASKVK